jgi:hypothetical protein
MSESTVKHTKTAIRIIKLLLVQHEFWNTANV